MRLVYECPQFGVFDDVLAPDAFEEVGAFVQQENYSSVFSELDAFTEYLGDRAARAGGARPMRVRGAELRNEVGTWNGRTKAWRLDDGAPLRGRQVVTSRSATCPSFPTGTGLDRFIDALFDHAERFAPWIGRLGTEWRAATVQPYLYPAGARLSWHRDAGPTVLGDYAFYVHPEWNVRWGGELAVALPDARGAAERAAPPPHLWNTHENARLLGLGVGTYVHPRPNRLVVIGRGHDHCITRVDPAAGDRVRCSISGFFVTEDAP